MPMPSGTGSTPELFLPLRFKVAQFLHESLVSFVTDTALLRKLRNTFENSGKNFEVEVL